MDLTEMFRRQYGQPSAELTPALPDGWTNDMSVPLPPGRTVAELVEHVIGNALRGVSDDDTDRELAATFGLSAGDAALARDRAFGGIVRAGTNNRANCPDPKADPIAFASFNRVLNEPSLVTRIYPQLFGGR